MEPMHGRIPITLVSLKQNCILYIHSPYPPAYTASTAGEQGFLQLLPIYLDHILYPTMTKASFLTEVGSSKPALPDILTQRLGPSH
jgi:hypothetical protein